MVKEDRSALLHVFKPLINLVPEVQREHRQKDIRTKAAWTLFIVLIFLAASQIPLYGILKEQSTDPLPWLRIILASNKGTLMELGISPIVTASMIMQLLVGANFIKFDQNNKDQKSLFEGGQKLLGIVMALGQAFAYTWSGMYGSVDKIGYINASLIIFQLTFSSIIVILLDDLMVKGYGIGSSGTSLFIAINIAQTVIWKALSPMTIKINGQGQTEGAILAFLYSFISGNIMENLFLSFFRDQLPNLINLAATVVVFLIVIYFQGLKETLPLCSTKSTGIFPYQIKLFYTSNIPIILQTALVSNLYFVSQMLFRALKGYYIIQFLGSWQQISTASGMQSIPVGGLIYYITPPRALLSILTQPIHTVFYIVFFIGTCALFSRTWIEVSGQGPQDVQKKFRQRNVFIKGHTDHSTLKILRKKIPSAATLGGVCIGILTIAADLIGAVGTGTGILLAVGTIYVYVEQFKRAKQQLGFM